MFQLSDYLKYKIIYLYEENVGREIARRLNTAIMEEYGSYLVIKILSPNRNDLLKEYECVPKSWVKVKDHYDNYVVFGYPLEHRLDARLRVIEYQSLDTKWPILYGEVVFNTDSQEEAFRFLETKMHEYESDSDQSKDTGAQDDDKEVETTTLNKIRIKPFKLSSKKTNRPSNRKQSDQDYILQNNKIQKKPEKGLELIFLEAKELIRTYATDVANEETVSSSMSNNLHNIQIPDRTQILPNETENVTEETPVNKENAEKITARPRRQSTRTRHLSQSYLEFSDEEFDRFDDSNYAPDTVPAGVPDQDRDRAADQDINMSLIYNQVYSHCYNFYVEFNESYQKTISIIDNAADYLQRIISTHKDNGAAKAIQSPLPTNHQPDVINSNMFSDPQPLLQERTSLETSSDGSCSDGSCSDENTKWTVRYPEPGPGIIELLPHSGVYVSERGLNACKSTYNETTKFTRALLEEVFTDEALKKCSFTGTSRKNVKNVKPPLDLKAREIFVEYVLQYSREMGWKKADPDVIMTCIRNRLASLHRIG